MTKTTFDRVITRQQAARLLGVSVKTLRRIEDRRELQPVRVSDRVWGYRNSALQRYLYDRTRAEPCSDPPWNG
jgi:hypothetical protein